MRFCAPRSVSPSPARRSKSKPKRKSEPPNTSKRRSTSTFGLNTPSDEDDSDVPSDEGLGPSESDYDDDTDSDLSEASSSDSDSFCYGSESEVPAPPPRPSRLSLRPVHEQQFIEDTVAAIRSRMKYNDPYEDWEREMKKDSLLVARKEHSASQAQLRQFQSLRESEESQLREQRHAEQQREVAAMLEKLRLSQQEGERVLREKWQQREKMLWDRIEKGIKLDEDRVRAKEEEARRMREEEERRRKEAEEKRLAEEKKKREEEEKKRKEEEEERKRVQEEKEAREREVREKTERLQAESKARKEAGLTTAEDDWAEVRRNLSFMKTQGTKFVKANRELKSMWGAARRQITPKVGQITNDSESINRISAELIQILVPQTSNPQVYTALLSSLSKAFLLQAETEVTAEKKSVIPLAQVAFNCLDTLEGLPEVFFSKIHQRIGGWAIPFSLPEKDFDGRPWTSNDEMRKVSGRREGESESEYTDRVMGVMRLYFAVLRIKPVRQPLKGMWQLPRIWTWFARFMGEKGLLETPVGAQVLYVALDVLGKDARAIWGLQFVKLLALIYEGTTTGLGNGKLIGGTTPEGIAARARVQLEVEAIMKD
ncbi:Nuclear pore complex nucleoporin component [Stygiomarasmius scandens]|uniref:mRNA export factor GLE1 n=1 Tax=Marasmiellus scandens TaxID=2682957 RepID=A0ABR1J9J7_9AGAR